MQVIDERKFLRNQEVVKEIERYRWIESMKYGFDVGFIRAMDEWSQRHAAAWIKYYMPDSRYKKLKPRFQRTRCLRQSRY